MVASMHKRPRCTTEKELKKFRWVRPICLFISLSLCYFHCFTADRYP